MVQSFLVICPNVSRTFVELRVEMPYWCTVLVRFGEYNLLIRGLQKNFINMDIPGQITGNIETQ